MAKTLIMNDTRPDGAGGYHRKGETYTLADDLAHYYLSNGIARYPTLQQLDVVADRDPATGAVSTVGTGRDPLGTPVVAVTGPGGGIGLSAGAAPWTPARASRLWVVPPQPAAMAHVEGAFADVSWNAEQIAQNLFDPLVSSAPGYATRTIAGRDATDTYNVYRYDFTPEYGYDRTLILVGALHGSEIVGTLALARVLHYIVNDPHCHEDIAYILSLIHI